MTAFQKLWGRFGRIERYFIGWAITIGTGFCLKFLRREFTPGNFCDVLLEFVQLIAWHAGITGVLVTASAAVIGVRKNRQAAEAAANRVNRLIARIILMFFAALLASEALMRAVFREGESFSDNSGPIVQLFAKHAYAHLNRFGSRGPDAFGSKSPDRIRLLIQGDSITFGQGIRNSDELYPSILLRRLNEQFPNRFEASVLAQPGREIDGHLDQMEIYGAGVAPDVIIYQWYTNDVELDKSLRPRLPRRFWEKWFLDPWLKEHSYAWWFLDDRLKTLLPKQGTLYFDYMHANFDSDTPAWGRFAALFHYWSIEAKSLSPRVLIMLCPQPEGPMGDGYIFRQMHQRVIRLADKYGIKTLDLIQTMNDVDSWNKTYVSRFERHPNAWMHQRMAEALYANLKLFWPELLTQKKAE